MNNKNYLISVTGPTAVGKTNLSIEIAKKFNSEIISFDSRQFYKEMSIGTAVPNFEQLASVKHHFIQNKSIHDKYTVKDFSNESKNLIEKLFRKNNIIVVFFKSSWFFLASLHKKKQKEQCCLMTTILFVRLVQKVLLIGKIQTSLLPSPVEFVPSELWLLKIVPCNAHIVDSMPRLDFQASLHALRWTSTYYFPPKGVELPPAAVSFLHGALLPPCVAIEQDSSYLQ